MKFFTTILLLITTTATFSQTQEQNDSLVTQLCKTITESTGANDSITIVTAFEKHLIPYFENISEEKKESVYENIFFRLQKNCILFKKMLDKVSPQKGDWEYITEKPETRLTNAVCKDFLKVKQYAYLENSGDTVFVKIKNGQWTEHFKDDSYSKLKIEWITPCDFKLTFIESNNIIRKNLSKPGEQYWYRLVDKQAGYYNVVAEVKETQDLSTFKIYY